jgi:TFIIF-interacting CTD phosphatase-like protein
MCAVKFFKNLLILDLDETLIHTTYERISGIHLQSQRGYFYLYERPYLGEFLHRHKSQFSFAIWSASKSSYVKWVINNTALREFHFEFIYTRKNCKRQIGINGEPIYLKNLNEELFILPKIIFLDDTPQYVAPIELTMKVPEFRGDFSDRYLKELCLLSGRGSLVC